MKTGRNSPDTDENELWSAKHENGRTSLRTAENESGSLKHEKWTDRRKWVMEQKIWKMNALPPGAAENYGVQNLENGCNSPSTVDNEFWNA
jgi:hypothetical protein